MTKFYRIREDGCQGPYPMHDFWIGAALRRPEAYTAGAANGRLWRVGITSPTNPHRPLSTQGRRTTGHGPMSAIGTPENAVRRQLWARSCRRDAVPNVRFRRYNRIRLADPRGRKT